jgi:hypothetical protein
LLQKLLHRPATCGTSLHGGLPNMVTATMLATSSRGISGIAAVVTAPPCEWPPSANLMPGHVRARSSMRRTMSLAPWQPPPLRLKLAFFVTLVEGLEEVDGVVGGRGHGRGS